MNESASIEFDRRKTAYCAEFAVAHHSAFRPHLKQGETLGKGPDVWRNVSEHCLVAGIFADILAEGLNLPQDQRERVVAAALLHDWYKKHEQIAQRLAAKEGTLSLQTFDDIRDRDYLALRDMGINESVIQLTGSSVPEAVDGPKTDPEKIVWYVDVMLSNTEPVPIHQRIDNLDRGWDGFREDPERASRNKDFSDSYRPKYGGKSLYDVQREVGDRVGREFSERMGFSGEPANLPLYLKDIFVERVNSG